MVSLTLQPQNKDVCTQSSNVIGFIDMSDALFDIKAIKTCIGHAYNPPITLQCIFIGNEDLLLTTVGIGSAGQRLKWLVYHWFVQQ